MREWSIVGELALDSSIRPIKGALPMAMSVTRQGIGKMLVPAVSAREAAVVKPVAVYPSPRRRHSPMWQGIGATGSLSVDLQESLGAICVFFAETGSVSASPE